MKTRRGKPIILTDEEREIEESVKRGEWAPISETEKQMIGAGVRASVESRRKEAKEERVSIRTTAETLALLKAAADKRGMGYQTLAGSVLHMFAHGLLVEKNDLRDVLETLRRAGGIPSTWLTNKNPEPSPFQQFIRIKVTFSGSAETWCTLGFNDAEKRAVVFTSEPKDGSAESPLIEFKANSIEDAKKKAPQLVRDLESA